MSSFGGKVNFLPVAKGNFNLNYGEWSRSQENGEQTQALSITNNISSSNNVPVQIRIRMYVPYTNVTLPALSLNQNGGEYEALVSEIPEGTSVYRAYGAGQICCFYGSDGEELVFSLPDSAAETFDATLTLADRETDTTGFRLIVETVNTESKGEKRL